MIVSRSTFSYALTRIGCEEFFSLDCETQGLMLWQKDRLFSIAISTDKEDFYFNFQDYEGINPEEVLPREYLQHFSGLLGNPDRTLAAHNSTFDLAALYQEGIEVKAIIHDTEVGAVLERNDHMQYSLSACAKRIGLEKSDAVEEWITENHAWEWRTLPGKKTRIKNKFFWKVPFPIISQYAQIDARVTYELARHQIKVIGEYDQGTARGEYGTLQDVLELERKITPVVFDIEKVGVQDRKSVV